MAPKVADSYLEARKQSILDAAMQVFSQKGIKTATMAEIAREADISPGAIYRYFDSKEALALGCFNENAAAIAEAWIQVPATVGTPYEDMVELADTTFRQLEGPTSQLDAVIDIERVLHAYRESDDAMLGENRANLDAVTGGIAARLDQMKEEGELTPAVDSCLLAGALLTFYEGMRLRRLIDPELDTLGELHALMTVLRASGSAS